MAERGAAIHDGHLAKDLGGAEQSELSRAALVGDPDAHFAFLDQVGAGAGIAAMEDVGSRRNADAVEFGTHAEAPSCLHAAHLCSRAA